MSLSNANVRTLPDLNFLSVAPIDVLSVFFIFRALAKLMQATVFYPEIASLNNWSWLTSTGLSLIIILLRGSIGWSILLILLQIFILYSLIPFNNHTVYDLILDGTVLYLLISEIIYAQKSKKTLDRAATVRRIGPALLVATGATYFVAGFHKLNWEFLDPAASCASMLLDKLSSNNFYFLGYENLFKLISIWFTLLFEFSMPFLLFFSRTRLIGLSLGILFHLICAFIPDHKLFDYTFIVFTVYFLLIPNSSVIEKIKSLGLIEKWLREIFVTIAFTTLSWGYFNFPVSDLLNNPHFFTMAQPFNNTYPFIRFFVLLVGLLFFYLCLKNKKQFNRRFSFSFTDFSLMAPLIIVFSLGVGPYIGFLGYPSFSMFSNLRTFIPDWNHILMSSKMKIFNFEEDLVQVVNTNQPKIRHQFVRNKVLKGATLTTAYTNLFSLSNNYDGEVEFLQLGAIKKLTKLNGEYRVDGALITMPYWQRKLAAFRANESNNIGKCPPNR